MSLAERWKAALEQNQESWRNRIKKEEPIHELSSHESRKSLQSRRSELEQAANSWRKRFLPNGNNSNDNENCENVGGQASPLRKSANVRRRSPLGTDNHRNYIDEVTKYDKLSKKLEGSFEPTRNISTQANVSIAENKSNDVVDSEVSLTTEIINNSEKMQSLVENCVEAPMLTEENSSLNEKPCLTDTNNNLLKNPKRPTPARRLALRHTKQEELAGTPKAEVSNNGGAESAGTKKDFVLGKEFATDETKKTRSPFSICKSNLQSQITVASETNFIASASFKLPSDAFQTPVIGVEHCGVKLRQVDTKSQFPEVMLIQFCGGRPLNIRLVCPKLPRANFECLTNIGTFLLVTRNRLIIWSAENSTVFEKSKASQMAYDILAGKELSCFAQKVEIANDDRLIMAEFKRILSGDSRLVDCNLSSDVNTNKPNSDDISENFIEIQSKEFCVGDILYTVNDKEEVEEISRAEAPSTRHFDSTKILIFDFATEIYIWIGQCANRSLIPIAMKHAERLKASSLTNEQCAIFGVDQDLNERPCWSILRKQTQGIADCLFHYKFENFSECLSQLSLTPATPDFTKKKVEKRPWSVAGVPSAFNRISASAMSNRISSLCSDAAYFGILKDEEKLIDNLAQELGNRPELVRQSLQLEGNELKVTDENIFTEKLLFYRLANEENLECLGETLLEFNNESCYVIEWHYRIEREGIRRLNGHQAAAHDTGRQRVAYFYWLGSNSTIKDRSRCALALRNFDKDRHEHIRTESGHESPVLLNLLGGKMIVSGTGSGWFLVIGSSGTLFSTEELPEPVEFRPQGVYLHISIREGAHIVSCWYGFDCSEELLKGAQVLGAQLAMSRNATFNPNLNELNAAVLPNESKFYCSIKWNHTAARLYRLYGNEGEELVFERYDKGINFTFRQSDLRDCILVDQGTHLWIWSDNIVQTFELKVAHKIWHTIKKRPVDEDNTTVIIKDSEPEAFKALFPIWNSTELINSSDTMELSDEEPQSLDTLLHERTRFRSPDELRSRKLPKGCDTKHLERYLNDTDFMKIFQCAKDDYEKLPRWKQISLKKAANLF